MEELITEKIPALVNLQFYQLCKLNQVDEANDFISEIKPLFITIISDLLQPLKEEGKEAEFDATVKRFIDLCFLKYDLNYSYELDQNEFISFLKKVIICPDPEDRRIMKKHFGDERSDRMYLQNTFSYFQGKYNYSSGKDALTFPNQLDFPSFGRLKMSEKRDMTLRDVKRLTFNQKREKISSFSSVHKLSLIVLKCTQLYETNCLLSSLTNQQIQDIHDYFETQDIYDTDIELELKSRHEKEIEEEEVEVEVNIEAEVEEDDLRIDQDVDSQDVDFFEQIAIEEENEPIVIRPVNTDNSITGEVNKLLKLNEQAIPELLNCTDQEKVQYEVAPFLGTGELSISVFDKLSKTLFGGLSSKSIFGWIKRKWDTLGTGITYLACSCGYTAYILDKKDLIDCTNPKCDIKKRRKVKMRYESIRIFLALLYLDEGIRKGMELNRATHLENNETLDSVLNGNLYRRSMEKEKEPNTFCFNLGLSMDGCNVHSKTMMNTEVVAISILDLPPQHLKEKEFAFVPTFFQNRASSPGSNRELLKILMTDFMDLWNEGFKVTLNGVTHTIYANIVTFTGDIPSIAASLELQSQKATFPCSFCKIQKISTKSGELPLSFNNLENNPMVTSDELRDLARRKEFPTQSNIWKLKGDNMFTVFTGFDFMRSVSPDLMHVVLENIFPKRICASLLEKNLFKSLNKNLFEKLNWGVTSIKNYLNSKGMFEEPSNLDKFFTQEASKSRLKAVDSKLFGHAFPLMAKCNLGMDNIHSEILGLLVEINQHLLCFMAQGVPREDVPLLKENYIKLMQRVEELSKEHKFLNIMFCLPTHYVIHMFEKWCDVGSFF